MGETSGQRSHVGESFGHVDAQSSGHVDAQSSGHVNAQRPSTHVDPHWSYDVTERLRDSWLSARDADLRRWLAVATVAHTAVTTDDADETFGWWEPRGADRKEEGTKAATTAKKKRAPADGSSSGSVNYVESNKRRVRGAEATDISELERGLWRGCVEARTYRYISNNGAYRAAKGLSGAQSAVHTLRRHTLPAQAPAARALTLEQQQLQREIQRELRREFDMLRNQGQWAQDAIDTVQAAQPAAPRAVHQATAGQPTRRAFSPVELPPINLPLVNKNLVKAEDPRSMSEPPPGSGGTLEPSRVGCFEVQQQATDNRRSGARQKAWSTKETDIADIAPNSLGIVITSSDKRAKTRSKEAQKDPPASSDVAHSQLRYMAASGQVSETPQSRNSCIQQTNDDCTPRRESRPSDYSPRDDARGNKENHHNSALRATANSKPLTNLVTALHPKPRGTDENLSNNAKVRTTGKRTKVKGRPLNFVSADSNSTSIVEGFRAAPIGRLKSRDKKHETVMKPDNDFLPQISGHKCDMSATSHRVV